MGDRARVVLVDYVGSGGEGGTALRAALAELGQLEVVARVGDHLNGDAALVVVYVAATAQMMDDLPVLAEKVRRDALVLVLSFGDMDYSPFAAKAQAAFGTTMPKFVSTKKNSSGLEGAIWFREGVAEIEPMTAKDWSLTRMLGRARTTTAAKLMLYPAVAQQGLAWAALPRPKTGWGWRLKVYGPLAAIVLGPVLPPVMHEALKPVGVKHVEVRRKQLLQFESDHYVGGIPATARELDDGQVKQLAELQAKLYAAAKDEAACEGLASGSESARDAAVATLSPVEIDRYFDLLQLAFIQPTRDFADFKPKYKLAMLDVGSSLPDEEQQKFLTVWGQLDDSPTAADLCWFNARIVKHYGELPQDELIPAAMRVSF